MTSTLGTVNLLEQLTEPGKSLMFYQFLLKGYDKTWMSIQMEGSCRVWCVASIFLWVPVQPHVHPPENSSNPIFWGFLWRLHHTGIINPKLHFQPFSLLKRMVGRAENSKFLIMVKSYWWPACCQEPCRSPLKVDPLEEMTLSSLRKVQEF